MLEPNDRRLLLESLRPPEGFQLDFAVATTFSLDLIALLTTPVAFTFYDWEHEDGRPVVEPLALLEALSRHAERLAIFCQADRIIVPRQAHGLFAFLEGRVFPVRAPNPEGVFHPKVWALRYTDAANAVRYRLLVSSRNLTFDRSWDTLLVLDGELEDRKVGHSYLRPLGEFFAALPRLGRAVPDAVSRRVGDLAAEIRRVRFDFPQDVDEMAFWPLGLGIGADWPFRSGRRRLLVVSPFVTGDCLRRLADVADDRVLVSDAVELAKLPREALAPIEDVRVLSPVAQAGDPEADAAEGGEVAVGLSGLHAKVYVLDQGREARIWTGSANATDAAFGRNVEFLAELVGSKSRIGIDALLAERKGEPSFASLLEPYDPAPEERDEVGEALTQLVEYVRKALGAAPLALAVTPGAEADTFSLELRGPRLGIDARGAEVGLACRPITLGDGQAAAVDLNQPVGVVFPKISFDALTSFVAFTVTANRASRVMTEQFVLNLPLEGAPAGRRERIIQNLLRDQRAVLRFILMLLADDVDLSAAAFARAGEGLGSFALGFGEDTVLESLLRALVREPRRLDRVDQLLKDLRSGDEPPTLPEGFAGIWSAVWAARQAGTP